MTTKCNTLKILKILLVTCLTLVTLQYVINLVAYSYVSRFFGMELMFRHNISLVQYIPMFGKQSKSFSSFNKSVSVIPPYSESVKNLFPSNTSQINRTTLNQSPTTAPTSPNISLLTKERVTNESLPLCPLVPPKLVGPLATYTNAISFEEILKNSPNLQPGGRYKPKDCVARHKVAIIIPYRDRITHLQILLQNLHPILERQLIDYGIYVVDMTLPTSFNRAMLMNIGFAEALKIYDYQCFIFHDVDLIPENDRNLYTCPESPRHMSVAVDKFKYKLPYASIFGGVSALTKEQMLKINGYSNLYFGWGGEDDDMNARIHRKGYKVIRYSVDVARYKMIKHTREKSNPVNPKRYKLINTGKARQDKDGINSLKYKVEKIEFLPTYTYILTTINQTEVEAG
ncbi:beta-1,4-N-acetylgalactosaminyltransferase bre-4 [Patella vulgata]|uniref:beta-1,4-N-acetylgalactosaminyltransferase bre-4 n=1 Tax=Patella vulgata TaxID=6465 RepID=UPI0021802363|nr:beta-1,4-N-acetylgalactosaminyltransferase bre-4 [Patella vulgata]XP_050391426.1 beta-1,4-N-acetylgalactosaminyltransferase bre-4 [Patella vulgata]